MVSASTVVTIPSAPVISITNSVCTTGCAPSGGSFDITTACTTGTLTYYTDAMGAGATTTAPTYNQTGPAQIIYYACVDINGCGSAIQTSATTVPGTCTPVTAAIAAPVTALDCSTTQATLTATGGVSYFWAFDNSTDAALIVTAGSTYTVEVTGANGCTDTESVTVTQDISTPTAGITAPVTELTCLTTSVTLTATGGGTYEWDDNSTNAVRTVSATGTYTVIVTGTNGCTATESVTVTQDISTPTAGITAPITELTCLTTSVTLTATGVGSYTWDDSSTASARTVSAAGTYTVIVTGANGCTDTEIVIVTEDTAITAGITASATELTCTTTSVTLTATGGATYLWDDTNNTATAALTVSAAGTYTVIVTGANGCTDTESVTVTQDITAPTAGITAPVTELTCTTTSVTLTATGGATYLWDDTNNTATAALTVSAAGIYNVTVTGANGCTDTESVTVTQNITAPTAGITAPVTELTCTITSVTLTVTGGATYLWSDNSTDAALTVSAAGTYTVIVTGANGCTDTESVTVTHDITAPTAGITAPVTELTCTTTSATLTATGGATYAWDDTNNTATAALTVSAAGTYTVIVTGANGCTDTESVTVTQDITAPTAGITAPVTELTCTATSVNLTATGGATYLWDDNSTNAALTVSAAGTYNVTVTGANGCTATATVTVTQNITTPTAGITAPVTQLTYITTSATLTATGGGTYNWDDNSTNDARTITAAGTYTVTVTGANGCTATATVTVTQDISTPTAGITAPITELTCTITSVILTATGGGTYAWDDSSTAAPRTVSAAGTYTVTVTGANGGTATATVTVTQNITLPTAGITNTDGPLTCLLLNAKLSATGGGTYSWNTTETAQDIFVTTGGTYTVTVTGANGCTATATTIVTTDYVVLAAVSPTTGTLSCTTLSVAITASGGGTYLWGDASTSATRTVTTAGTYTVTVTGTNGCTATATSVVTGVAGVSIATASNSGPVCEGGTITLSVEPNLSVGVTATYLWNGGAGTATTQNPSIKSMTSTKTGVYTVTVTYSNGCTTTATTTLAMNPKPVISSVVSTCVAGLANITVNATGTGLTYNIGTGAQTSNAFTGIANGTYVVTVTNSFGCTAKSTISVFCQTCPTITASNNGPACAGGNLLLSVNPALPNGVTATYFWNGPGGIATIQNPTITNFSPGKAGVYTVTVTYSNGCTATASTTATIAPSIAGSVIGPNSFCTGGSAVLTATGGLNYVWSTSATTPAITVTTAGTYVVTITNGPGCKRVSRTITTVTCKDEEDLSQMQSLSVTPNPFAGRATIEFMTNSNGHTSINVYSIDGRMLTNLYNANTQAGEIYQVTLDGANLPNGMYFVEMTNANGKKMLVKAILSN